MKRTIQIALFCLVLSVILHGYLAYHYYPLKFGTSDGNMACNVSETFSCSSVSASPYAALFGIPMALWGLVLNALLLGTVFCYWLGWSEKPQRLHRFNLLLACGSVLASLAMGGISLVYMSAYCLFCFALYFLSLCYFIAIWSSQPESPWAYLKEDILSWFGESKIYAALLLAIPATAFLLDRMVIANFGAGGLEGVVHASIADWKSAPQHQFPEIPALRMGPPADQAKMSIAEFADFRCGHCRHAAPSLHAFTKGHPDVEFKFYTFPLDGDCNAEISHKDGISCRLAKAVACAGRQDKGWQLHDFIYDNQDTFSKYHSVSELDTEIKKASANMTLDWNNLLTCMDSAEIHEAISAQAKAGVRAGVKGTPTIYVNGRLLERGQLIPVLEAARKSSLQTAK